MSRKAGSTLMLPVPGYPPWTSLYWTVKVPPPRSICAAAGAVFPQTMLFRIVAEVDDIEDIVGEGLHGYLTRFLEDTNELGNLISQDFLVPMA